MKEIKLSNGQVTIVDDDDYDYLMQWKWTIRKTKTNNYVQRSEWRNGKDHSVYMHRIIMKTPPDMQVDHIDHNGLNNQKINLRNCTRSQNHMNYLVRGQSKYIGVSFNKDKIRAIIKINGKQHFLGHFHSEIEAAKAYDREAKIHHGEFANLNFK